MNEKIMSILNQGHTVVCDMDGVIADFNAEKMGIERFATEKGFFKNLSPIVKNLQALKQLISVGVRVKILSASPNIQADKDKLSWLSNHLKELNQSHVILCRNTDNKADFIDEIEGCVLIDDYTENLIKWKTAGGLTIKYLGENDSPIGRHTTHNIPHIESLGEIY